MIAGSSGGAQRGVSVGMRRTPPPPQHAPSWQPAPPSPAPFISQLTAGRAGRPAPSRTRSQAASPGIEPGVYGKELRFQQSRQFGRGGAFVPYPGAHPGTEANVAIAPAFLEHLAEAALAREQQTLGERVAARREIDRYGPGRYPWETLEMRARGRRMLQEAQRAPASELRMTIG